MFGLLSLFICWSWGYSDPAKVQMLISIVKPKQIAPGQFAWNSVIFFYEEKDWSTEIENVILDSDDKKGITFSLDHPSSESSIQLIPGSAIV
ncbi:hypothetical protein [Paenibacillus sp. PSB04]|uniref:hypothetical protein n=1 Tax=Paenibacillus sp. PSB04 TaxID=2866810 RepID=UPI0021F23AD4|nr:hypothetical protein [Paenibacillus sp. PSB04]UYO06420.1 hypothetical protein K2F33_11340 [Paenibacillus sp. PSB04]